MEYKKLSEQLNDIRVDLSKGDDPILYYREGRTLISAFYDKKYRECEAQYENRNSNYAIRKFNKESKALNEEYDKTSEQWSNFLIKKCNKQYIELDIEE